MHRTFVEPNFDGKLVNASDSYELMITAVSYHMTR